ncbi:dihydropyrimidine dehydrogenase [Halobacteriales archaeon QS_3_64_16]|nr:MAG: dihydropyrimidine dehydrogenase [Halobacteriales archaeon QS_3_64_16]
MFEPRVALASLSGAANAEWARAVEDHAGAAFLGGIALCAGTRRAARRMAEARDREEFLPTDPLRFVGRELGKLEDASLTPGINVRSAKRHPLRKVGAICANHGAICELNAHCRQPELCAAGVGETLLRDAHRLCEQVEAVAATGANVSVKVRAEVPGVDLGALAGWIEAAGADAIHVDAMDSEEAIAEVAETSELFVIANNEVRDRASTEEYLAYGADAVSVGRASDRPAVLEDVRETTDAWFDGRDASVENGDRVRGTEPDAKGLDAGGGVAERDAGAEPRG